MTELKPCPFCGGKAQYGKETDEFGVSHHFVGCGCIEGCFSSGSTEEQAIEAWNKRPNPWHTGTPTEEGEYVVICQYIKDDGKLRIYKTVFEFKNGEWTNLPILENNLDEFELIAWHGPIPVFTERKVGEKED